MVCRNLFAVFVFAILIANIFAATVFEVQKDLPDTNRFKRDIELNNVEDCKSSTPCGWAVYQHFSRSISYFIRNTCKCPGEKSCVRSEDDLSVSAYVYRCKIQIDTKE